MRQFKLFLSASVIALVPAVASGLEHTQTGGIDPVDQNPTPPGPSTPPAGPSTPPSGPSANPPGPSNPPSGPTAQNPNRPQNIRLTSTPRRANPVPSRQAARGPGITNPAFSTLSTSGTGELRESIAVANEICSWFPVEVRIDCIADRFEAIARSIPSTGEYAPVRAALEEAAAQLRGISGKYANAGSTSQLFQAPSPVDGSPVRTSRLTSVSPDLQSTALSEALEVVDELETKLLRSAENSRKRQVHFQEISASISSTKVLLRSA